MKVRKGDSEEAVRWNSIELIVVGHVTVVAAFYNRAGRKLSQTVARMAAHPPSKFRLNQKEKKEVDAFAQTAKAEAEQKGEDGDAAYKAAYEAKSHELKAVKAANCVPKAAAKGLAKASAAKPSASPPSAAAGPPGPNTDYYQALYKAMDIIRKEFPKIEDDLPLPITDDMTKESGIQAASPKTVAGLNLKSPDNSVAGHRSLGRIWVH